MLANLNGAMEAPPHLSFLAASRGNSKYQMENVQSMGFIVVLAVRAVVLSFNLPWPQCIPSPLSPVCHGLSLCLMSTASVLHVDCNISVPSYLPRTIKTTVSCLSTGRAARGNCSPHHDDGVGHEPEADGQGCRGEEPAP